MSSLFSGRWENDKPLSIEEFVERFPDDNACAEFIASVRWPSGFVCPRCGNKNAWKLQSRPGQYKCAATLEDGTRCHRQTSVISGTIMHRTRIPLRKWFLAAYFDMTHSNGISALQLQPKLGLGSYKSAWLLLQKLRKAMINPERIPLQGVVEVDEGFLPFRQKNIKGKGDSLITIAVAAEKIDEKSIGRVRLQRVKDKSRGELRSFILANTKPGTEVITDANSSYGNLEGRTHIVKNLSAPGALPAHIELPAVHRAIALLKRLMLGVFHGARDKHIDRYLNEFEFRWNRRRHYSSIVETLMRLCVVYDPVTYREIVGDTSTWKRENRQRIYKLVNPERLKEAKSTAKALGCDVLDILEELPPVNYGRYARTPAKRPVLGKPKKHIPTLK